MGCSIICELEIKFWQKAASDSKSLERFFIDSTCRISISVTNIEAASQMAAKWQSYVLEVRLVPYSSNWCMKVHRVLSKQHPLQ